MRRAFAVAGYRSLFAGLTTSMLGDSVMLLVLSIWVKTLTDSNARAGLTFLFMTLPTLAAPLLGVWVDRLPRRPVLVWGHGLAAVMVLPLVLVRDAGDVWLIWAVAVLYGVSQVVLPAALNGMLKDLLPDDVLVEANASLATTREGFRLFGPLAGALLFAAVGGWLVALVDAATFAVAALLIAAVHLVETPAPTAPTGAREEVWAGLRFLRADRVLRHTVAGFTVAVVAIGFFESAIYAMLDAFDRPPTWASGFVSVMGVGAVVGGLLAARVVRRLGEVGACATGLVVAALGTAVGAAAPTFGAVLGCAALIGVGTPITSVALTTLQQRRTPRGLVGRVSTAVSLAVGPLQALSLAVGALLVSVLDYRAIFWIIAAGILAGAGQIMVSLREELRPGRTPADAVA